jgi:mannose-1-phosphate guanylyltransferase/phosphomannomutase
MMEHILELLHGHGITDVVATVQFLGSVVRHYFGAGEDLDLSLAYANEDEPLGTAGSVKNAEPFLDDTFLVISGDTVTDIDLTAAAAFHRDRGAAVTVVLKRVDDPLEFGIVIADEEGRIDRFMEKPGWGEVFSDTINTGIYVIDPAVLGYIPSEEEFDFAGDLFPLLLDKGLPMYGFVADGYWTDVGNLDAYLTVHRDVLDQKVKLNIAGFQTGRNVWMGEGTEVDPGAKLEGPLYLGENSRVEAGAELRGYTVLGKGVVVKTGAFLHRAVVHDHSYVGISAALRGCVLGKNADVKQNARLEDGVVVADECHVGEGAVLSPNVKVYPFKTVDPGALVTQSIVWETRGTRGLFGERGVSGLVNIDITPERALRLALAFGGTMPKKSVVAASRDGTRAARLIKRAMVAGLNASGVDVHDLELAPLPVTRFYARAARSIGGIAVRTAPFDPQSVDIQFFDDHGIDIDVGTQRQIERAFYRDDLRRAFHHEIGALTFPARGREYYLRGLLDAVDVSAIQKSRPKVVVDYAFGGTTLTGPAVLGRVGANVLAVNAVLDEERVVLSQDDVERHVEQVAAMVRSGAGQIGAMMDSSGEHLRLIDGRGRVLTLEQGLLVFVELVARVTEAPRIAVPLSTTRTIEDRVRRAGGEVVYTRISPAALSAASEEPGVVFAGAEGGGYIFPEYLPAYDAVMSLAKLLELLALTGARLEEVVDGLPETHVVRRDVPTPWEAKGAVMRRLMERLNGEEMVTIDGVKTLRNGGWALVVPHPQEPVVRVWAEAGDAAAARSLVTEFARLVEQLRE